VVSYLINYTKEDKMEVNIAKLKDITVLYCEDEEYLRDITKSILESFTKKQYIGVDGKEGLELFRQNKDEIDLIITDVSMPNMTGLEMAKEIKQINPNIPIIVATAFSNSEYLLEAIELGIDKYVLKPVNIKKLLSMMASSLLYHELRDLYHDNLTKLENRNALLKLVLEGKKSQLALIDIDQFSVLNELYGEEFGDQILLKFTELLKKYFNSDESKIYRVGADKFSVLVTKENIDLQVLIDKSNQFLQDIEMSGITVEDTNIDLNLTIGIAQSEDVHTYEYAQRSIKKARREFVNLLVYDIDKFENRKAIEENMRWIKKLKTASSDGRFKPYFQPIVDSNTQKIYKYEALIRYINDDGSEVAPFHFLDIAKKAKLFPVISKVMLTSVVDIIKERNVRVAVNLSFDDTVNKETSKFIFDMLDKNRDITNMLDFEILESEEIKNFHIVRDFIAQLKTYGCNIGVDDFGAGYSNFNMLEELDVDFVKIDGSLIKEINALPKYQLIVETISQFCQKLNIKTVAEYICDKDVYETTKKLNIDYMQGYYFGKPAPEDSIA
jgi:diguanylate cyclase (GGDEF)-like protein